ncbi:unnamed protein product, partial [Ranitomeya imitator]
MSPDTDDGSDRRSPDTDDGGDERSPDIDDGGNGRSPDTDDGDTDDGGDERSPDTDDGGDRRSPDTDDGGDRRSPDTDDGGDERSPDTDDGGNGRSPDTDDGGDGRSPDTDDGGNGQSPDTDDGNDGWSPDIDDGGDGRSPDTDDGGHGRSQETYDEGDRRSPDTDDGGDMDGHQILMMEVEVDASEIGAGAVLSKRESDGSLMKPKFSPAERNYDVGNRELLAMKWAFEEWRHWLEGTKHRVVVLTDHKNLIYLESAKRLNPRQARWSLFFSRFDFVVSYLPGSKNVKADALSRSFWPDSPGVLEPVGILKEGVILSAISPDLRRVLQEFQADRPDRCPVGKLFVPDRWTSKVEPSDCPGVDSVVDRLQQIWTHVVDNLKLSQERAQRFANRRRSLLRRYVVPFVPSVDPPAPVLVEGELEYEVEKILDSRFSRWRLQYLVKWKGYGQEDNSWVVASDVHATDLVCAFHLAHPDRPGALVCPAYQYELILSCWKLWEADLPSTPLVRSEEFLPGNRLDQSEADEGLRSCVATVQQFLERDVQKAKLIAESMQESKAQERIPGGIPAMSRLPPSEVQKPVARTLRL